MSYRESDAAHMSNKSKFINQPSVPDDEKLDVANCESRILKLNGDMRVGIFAIKRIEPGIISPPFFCRLISPPFFCRLLVMSYNISMFDNAFYRNVIIYPIVMYSENE